MPQDQPDKIAQQGQAASLPSIIQLFQIDLTSLGGPVFNMCPTTDGAYQNVRFGGVEYGAIDLVADGFEVNGKGQMPRPRLRISNVLQLASAAVIEFDDLIGGKVTRLRTYRQHLDDGADPDGDAVIDRQEYYIRRKVNHNKQMIEWELACKIDLQGVKLPRRQIVRDYCSHQYRYWDATLGRFDYTGVTCPYVADQAYDEYDLPQTTGALDRCAKKLSSCQARFGLSTPLPFRGFPGVGQI